MDTYQTYKAVFEASPDAIIISDPEGAILLANNQVENLFGYTKEELIGKEVELLIPEGYRKDHKAFRRHYIADPTMRKMGVGLKLFGQKKDGSQFPVEISLSPIFLSGKMLVAAAIRDVSETRKIEKMMEESEKKYHHLFENNPQPMWIYDLETLAFLNVNKAAVQHYGYSKEEFLNMELRDIRPPETVNEFFLDVAKDVSEFSDAGIWQHKKKNGAIIIVNVILHTIDYDNRKARLVLAIDITEQKKAEEEKRRLDKEREKFLAEVLASEALLKEAEQLAHMGSWQNDLLTGTVLWSDEAYRIFGYMPGEIQPDYEIFLKHVHPEEVTSVKKAIDEAIINSKSYEAEFRIIDKSGKAKRIYSKAFIKRNSEGQPVLLNGFHLDITENKELKILLAQSEQRYRQVVENVNDAIMIDNIEGKVVLANKRFLELYGYTEEDLQYLVLEDYIAPEYRQPLRNRHNKRIAGETVPELFEYEGLRKDGSRVWVEVQVSKVIEDGVTKGTQSAIRDITERKKSQIALSEAMLATQKINKELEQFAYMVSHDLQEPLRMIGGFLNLLQSETENLLDDAAKEYIHFAIDGAARMKGLIADLLEYSRVGTNKEDFAAVNLSELMQYVLMVMQECIDTTNASVKVHPLPVIRANKTLITQLFQNLVSNALKYHDHKPPQIEVGCTEEPGQWKFYVKDNGIGIDPKHFEKIFVIFQRLHDKSQYTGTGVGLAICKKIVEKHEGTIWVESEPEQGTTFYFTIPKNNI